MVTRIELIRLARSCVGTPFRHQGRIPKVGMDCVGLIRYPAVTSGLYQPSADYTGYGRQPVVEKMLRLLTHFLDPVEDGIPDQLLPADILWLRTAADPQHLALYTEAGTLIHAVSNGPGKVVEHGFKCPWPGRVEAVFRYRGVVE